MPPLLLKLEFDRVAAAKMPFFIKPVVCGVAAEVRAAFIDPNLRGQLDFMESGLAQRKWFAGADCGGADVPMGFAVEAVAIRGGLDAARPQPTGRLWPASMPQRPAGAPSSTAVRTNFCADVPLGASRARNTRLESNCARIAYKWRASASCCAFRAVGGIHSMLFFE